MPRALKEYDRLVLRKTPPGDAHWTSDIARDCKREALTTYAVNRILTKLERRRLVERVVRGGSGNPTSWRRTEGGTKALVAAASA